MKTRKNITTVAIIAALFSIQHIKAQTNLQNAIDDSKNKSTYRTAIGVRAGGTSGLTIKQFVGAQSALEGIVGMWNNGLSLTGLYERYVPTNTSGLNWYYGGGGHAAFETGTTYRVYSRYNDYYYNTNGGVGIGLDGMLGLEYKILPIPFAISIDLKPFFEINTNGNTYLGLDPGLGIKVAF